MAQSWRYEVFLIIGMWAAVIVSLGIKTVIILSVEVLCVTKVINVRSVKFYCQHP